MVTESKLDGLGSVTLRVTSPAGPFARGLIEVSTATTPVRNGTAASMFVIGARVSPLVHERSGLAAIGAALAVQVPPGVVVPGEAVLVQIGGTVPARAGTYAAVVNLDGESGPLVMTLVQVEVAALSVWGFGCMLLGLLLLGILKLLTGEGDLQTQSREVQRSRAAIHADLLRIPPPESRAENVLEIDRDLDDAARALAAPRRLSVVDHRLTDSTAALAGAREAVARLRKVMDESLEGGTDAAELERDWAALQKRFSSLDEATREQAGTAPQGLAKHVGQILEQARTQLLVVPARVVTLDIGAQVDRTILTQSAGDVSRARDMAHATRLWMQRATAELEKNLTIVLGLTFEADRMILDDAYVRHLAATNALPTTDRGVMLVRLEAIDAQLASRGNLQSLKEAQHDLGEVGTRAMRAQVDAFLSRRAEIEKFAIKELVTAKEPVETASAALSRFGGLPSPADKAARVGEVLAIWQGILGVVRDPAARQQLKLSLDAGVAAGKAGNLNDTATALQAVEREWQDYKPKHIELTFGAALGPICSDWRVLALQTVALTQGEVMVQSGSPEVAEWDRRLDRARRRLEAVAPEGVNCIGNILEASADVGTISNEVFELNLQASSIPLQTRLDAAEVSGVAAAVSVVQKLIAAPRDLQLTPRSAQEEPIVGQASIFDLRGLDPDWGTSVAVTVDWGDHTTLWHTDAESLRKGERLEHTYTSIGTVHSVTTAFDGNTIGRSAVDLYVKPSPTSRAERLADIFLTTQFALALLIASVVYYWRFHAEAMVFGSNGRHYVTAFALGFAAYAAVAELPKALAEFAIK